MQPFDANLLIALDALLDTGSVTAAAERTGVSVPAMSRTLLRIRKLMGDPIMVQAGRGLVPTPKALEIRARLHMVVQELRDLTRTVTPSLHQAKRTVTVRADESFISLYGAALFQSVQMQAPSVLLHFVSHGEEAVGPLREGVVDLDIGDIKLAGPEVKVKKLFTTRFVGVVRSRHALAGIHVTARRYVQYEHISASRRGLRSGPIDGALAEIGLKRTVSLVVPSFSNALAVAANSDLIAAVPEHLTELATALYRA